MAKLSKSSIEVSSDAAARVQIARDWIQAYPTDTEILVVAHSVEGAADLHLSVVSSTGSWFGIKRFTLNVLASRLAQHALAASATAPASNLCFTAVVARPIHPLRSGSKMNYL